MGSLFSIILVMPPRFPAFNDLATPPRSHDFHSVTPSRFPDLSFPLSMIVHLPVSHLEFPSSLILATPPCFPVLSFPLPTILGTPSHFPVLRIVISLILPLPVFPLSIKIAIVQVSCLELTVIDETIYDFLFSRFQ